MYQNKLAVAIKHNGKVLRENKDLVQLPFGSEFSVLVKNLNSRRVKFALDIDGVDVLDGTEIIVNSNSEIEVKRFIRNRNMNEGNAFKFVERTQSIEDSPRGIKIDDGVVRVEFWFEQEAPTITKTIHHHYDEWHYGYPYSRPYWSPPFGGPYYGVSSTAGDVSNVNIGSTTADVKSKGIMRGMTSSASAGGSLSSVSNATYNVNVAQNSATIDSFSAEVAEAGITVPGSKVEQKFTTVYGFNAETVSHVIVLRLAGKIGTVEVVAPVTVKAKQKCETCGKVNKATSKFCTDCGTALELV